VTLATVGPVEGCKSRCQFSVKRRSVFSSLLVEGLLLSVTCGGSLL